LTIAAVGARPQNSSKITDELGDGSQNLGSAWTNDGNLATAWFTLDLGAEQPVDEIRLGPRADKPYTLEIYVGNSLVGGQVSGSPVASCTPIRGATQIPTELQSCSLPQTSGRYVTVKLASGKWLKFYGVEVWGGGSGGGGGNIDPVAAFLVATQSASLAAEFDASSSNDPDGTLVNYAWDFGDGNSDTGITTSHTWATDGTYFVSLNVTDNQGATASVSRSVTVFGSVTPASKLTVSVAAIVARQDRAGNLIDEFGNGSQNLGTPWNNDGSNTTAWFTLDLGSEKKIEDVKLGPRGDRPFTLNITIGNTLVAGQVLGSPVATCTPVRVGTAIPVSLQSCIVPGTRGRYVTIKRSSGAWLKFYGVEVWGGP